MARTSLCKLATDAGLWPVPCGSESDSLTTIRIDEGDVLRYGVHAPAEAVAEAILRHHMLETLSVVDEVRLSELLELHGYKRPIEPRPLRRVVEGDMQGRAHVSTAALN